MNLLLNRCQILKYLLQFIQMNQINDMCNWSFVYLGYKSLKDEVLFSRWQICLQIYIHWKSLVLQMNQINDMCNWSFIDLG